MSITVLSHYRSQQEPYSSQIPTDSVGSCTGDLPLTMFKRLESSMAWHDANFLWSTAI